MGARTTKPKTVGSVMSSRQIAYAAVAGRQVEFNLGNQGEPILGYVVGMDDYHYLVAVVSEVQDDGDRKILPHLIHKGSVPFTVLPPDGKTLNDESPNIRVAVEEMGRGFWHFCDSTFFGKELQDAPEL